MATQLQAKPFTNIEISSFCDQIAMILKSGISTFEGVTIMLEDATSPEEKQIMEVISDNLRMTGTLYLALVDTGLFPDYMLNMIQIGEETGTLDEVMAALSVHYDREDSISKTIKSAVTYPLVMAGMLVAVITVLVVKVMPIFNQVFVQLGTEMTGFSRALMATGNLINQYSFVFIFLLILIVLGLLFLFRTEKGKQASRTFGYRFDMTRQLYEKMATCKFASAMALTLSSGINPERSMELLLALNEDEMFQKKIEHCQNAVNDGKGFAEALFDAGIFTGMYARMISIADKTGAMDRTMEKIAGLYQEEIDSRINNALAILEPTLVIALSLIVGVILLSVMLPLMGIMSTI